MNRSIALLQRLAAAAAAALLAMPLLVGSVAASSPYMTNCDTRLRATTSTTATVVDVIAAGTVVTASGTVSGGAWSADCGAGTVSGSSWYAITAINGTSTSTLYGAATVYAATGLFSAYTPPPPITGDLEGVDVSRYQGTIDYAQVRASGRRFVIAKATEGYGYLDPAWAANRSAVPAAGLRLGAYHFARPDLNPSPSDAKSEADWFVSQMGLSSGMLVPALDLEVHGTQTVAGLTAWVQAWLGEVYAKTGARAMIYTSPSFWRTYVGDSRWFADNGYPVLWVAHWTSNASPSVPGSNWGGKSWTFWQYADNGTVPGISGGSVDLDRYNGADLTKVTYGADFKLALGAVPAAKQGQSGVVAVNVQRTWWTAPVTLSVSGLPKSLSAALSATTTSGSSANLSFSTTTTPAGSYPFTVTATSLGVTRTTQGSLTVVDGVAPAATIKPSLFAGGTIGSTIPIRTSWGASDPSGISAFRAVRQANAGSWFGQSLSAPASTTLTQDLATSTTYRYGVRATDGAANTGSYAYGTAFQAIRSQQYSTAIHYSTGWTGVYLTAASGGSLRYGTRAGAWASFTFTGRSIGWVGYRAPTRGKADVYLDGVLSSTIDLYASSSKARSMVFAANWSTVGTHTIKIVVKGTAGRPRVDLDAFVRLTSG